MVTDVVLNKIEIIKRCIKRINEEYRNNDNNLENYTIQDSIVLNLQRACEAAIDLGMHIVAKRQMGIPQNSRDVFEMLKNEGYISKESAVRMKAMVGFRNIAVHDYQNLNIEILKMILRNNIVDFENYYRSILEKELEEATEKNIEKSFEEN